MLKFIDDYSVNQLDPCQIMKTVIHSRKKDDERAIEVNIFSDLYFNHSKTMSFPIKHAHFTPKWRLLYIFRHFATYWGHQARFSVVLNWFLVKVKYKSCCYCCLHEHVSYCCYLWRRTCALKNPVSLKEILILTHSITTFLLDLFYNWLLFKKYCV